MQVWEGPINCARKTGDLVPLNSRVIPAGEQVVFVKDPPPLLREKLLSDSAALDSLSRLNSLRAGSLDVASLLSDG